MKEKYSDEFSYKTRQILRENLIDPYLDRRNLVWAPLWSHTKKYSEDTQDLIQKAVLGGEPLIKEVLEKIAVRFINGDWAQA